MTAPIASAHTHMGTPAPGYQEEWMTHTVHWHGFARLPSEQGEGVDSPEFMLLGNQWFLQLYPGGREHAAAEGMMSLFLWSRSNKAIDIDFGFSVNDGNGKRVANKRPAGPCHFDPVGGSASSRGWPNFAMRYNLLSSLVNGTLVIEVRMKVPVPLKSVPPPFIPENPFAKNIQRMFLDENFGNISFAVGAQQKKNNTKKAAKTTPVMFHAHQAILRECLTGILADICGSKGGSTSSPIEITDVSPEVFRHLLHSAYGGKISDDDMKLHNKEIIDAANRYGVVNLKLEAEACFVGNTTCTIENVMEHLLYADSMNCALLKEAGMDFLFENSDEAMDKISFNDVLTPSLFRDVLASVLRGKKKLGVKNGTDGENRFNFNSMRISELRREAHEKGLIVDGSREMIITSLKGTQ